MSASIEDKIKVQQVVDPERDRVSKMQANKTVPRFPSQGNWMQRRYEQNVIKMENKTRIGAKEKRKGLRNRRFQSAVVEGITIDDDGKAIERRGKRKEGYRMKLGSTRTVVLFLFRSRRLGDVSTQSKHQQVTMDKI